MALKIVNKRRGNNSQWRGRLRIPRSPNCEYIWRGPTMDEEGQYDCMGV